MIHPPERIPLPSGELRRLRVEDAEALAVVVSANLAHFRPWLPWADENSATVAAQRSRAREAQEHWASGAAYQYSLYDLDQAVIGAFGLLRLVEPGAIKIGYWLAAGATGRGHATAAAGALTTAALALPDIERVEIHTDAENYASAAIPQRLGYRLDRVDRSEPQAPAESGRMQIWVTP